MAESLRDYFIRFMFKTEGFEKAKKEIEETEHGMSKFGKAAFEFNEQIEALKKIGEPFAKLFELVNQTAEEADELKDLAERTGIAADEIERLGYVAKMSGTDQETLMTGLKFLEKNMGEAAAGSKEARDSFAKLGIATYNSAGKMKSVQEILPDVAKAFEKLPDHASKTAYAMKLFGKAGQELVPMLEKGGDEVRELMNELDALGGTTSEEFIKSSEHYVDNIKKLTAAWKGVRQAISGPILDSLNKVTDGFIQWWKASGALIRSKIVEWTQQLVVSLESFWTTLKRLAVPLIALAALLNAPLLVMVGMKLLIAALIDDFANWMAGNDSLIGRAIDNWDKWLDEIAETKPTLAALLATFGDVLKFIAKGWKLLEENWDGFVAAITDGSWLDTVKDMFKMLGEFMLAPITDTWDKIKNVIFDAMLGMKNLARSLGLDSLAESLGSGAASIMRSNERSAPSQSLFGMTGALPGGSSTSSSSSVSAPVSITVNAAPGMDEKSIAEQVSKQVERHWDDNMRSGYNQLVPERY